MAEKKQTVMVLREDGATAPAVAPTTAAVSSFFVDLKPGQTIDGDKNQKAPLEANGESTGAMKPSLALVAASPVTSTLSSDTNSNLHPENLPPEATFKGITVTLDNNNMWNEFFRCKTEMILTKQGRRMFPSCRYRISGMEPFQSYLLIMDIIPMDNQRYKWSDHRWEPNGKSETHIPGRVFIHPESPASGHYWMQSPVSFYKLKLTNNVMDQEGHVILHSMHRYLPRLHIVPADKRPDVMDVNGPDVMTFSFPQTEFFAVTAYQNLSITQLKIDYNPFAKGFREDAANLRSLMPKLGSPSVSVEDESKNNKELGPLKNSLKALFAKRVPVEKSTEEQDPPTRKEGEADCKESNIQLSVMTGKSTVKRRPSTLSELFQGTPLKLKKTAPENSLSSTTLQRTSNGSVNPGGSLDLEKTSQRSVKEDIQVMSAKKEKPACVKSKEDSEQFPDDSNSHVQKSQTPTSEPTTGLSYVTKENRQKVSDISSEETGSGIKLSDSEEQSQNKSVPQKRAGAVALPLLALFFQQLKSKPKPVKIAPKPDNTESTCSSKGSASPSTNILLVPNTTHPSESCTLVVDTNTSSTLTPISSNKIVENILPGAPSECLTSPKIDDMVSIKTSPEMRTSSESPETHTSYTTVPSKSDRIPTAESDETKPQSLTPNVSEDPVNQSTGLATLSPLPSEADAFASATGSPSSPRFSQYSPAPSSDQEPSDPLPKNPDIPQASEQVERSEPCGRAGVASLVINSSNQLSFGKKPKGRPKKGRKSKQPEEPLLVGGPTNVRMQPNLEDVEGQLFVSFTSKEALEIHLGDNADESQSPPAPQKIAEVMEKKVETPESMAERIASLEKALLQDLKVMKHKQVIHPVLQEVGLKLNILDQILAIDLVYLGVELPIPPPSPFPGASSGGVSSSQHVSVDVVHFVSRTGKTTDITKIKGWRDKFVTPDAKESQPDGGTSADASLKNRSAFCSDMLDEYLASEGKLIDERAASFSTSSVTPVAYQMPTKSSSYVRTLDSVLKKRAPASTALTPGLVSPAAPVSTSISQTKKSKVPQKPKDPQKLGASTARRSSRTPIPKGTPTAVHPSSSSIKTQDALLSPSKKSSSRFKITPKTPPVSKPSTSETPPIKAALKGNAKPVTQARSSVCGRSVNLPPTVVKLLEVEDGAVWEGKERTFVTEERASIAVAALASTEGVVGENTSSFPIIKRRAPPCLSTHCRLGCVCTSLAQERRHSHCGKPECMLRCHCLRHKVVLLRKPKQEELMEENSQSSQTLTEDEEGLIKTKRKKKKKKKSPAYVLTDPPATLEPATRVRTLWNCKEMGADEDQLHIPTPVHLPCPLRYDIQPDMEDAEDNLHYENDESMMTCARIRPFKSKTLKEPSKKEENLLDTAGSGEGGEPEPGEYIHGPSKRLEVVSECKWNQRTDRTYIMRVLCDHMDKDRLKTPFWIGKYRIQPISQTVVDEGQGPCVNYKVLISQPQLGLLKDKIQTQLESKPPEPPKATATPKPEQHKRAPKPEPRVEPAPKMLEPLPKLRPEQGLPFLAGVPAAGLLVAQHKNYEGCPITVNGKSYPKARLQLGHMGALHPANRLAAYITGRLDPVNLPGYAKAQAQAQATSTASVTVTTTASAAKVTSVNTTATTPMAEKSTETKPTVGKVYTQFVVNQLRSQQQKLPCAGGTQLLGSIQKLVLSSNPLVVLGQHVAAQSSQKEQAGGTLVSTVTTSVATATTTSGGSSGGTPQLQAVLKILPNQQPLVLPAPPIRASAPAAIGARNSVAQNASRILLQPVRTSSGATLYRNPSGQLIQLVPLSQLRNLKPNLVLKDQKAFVRLPTPGTGAIPRGPTPNVGSSTLPNIFGGASVLTVPTSSSSVTLVSSQKPVTTSAVTTSTAPSKPTKIISLSGSSAFSIKTASPVLKVAPEFLGDTGTHTMRILPASPGTQGSPLAKGVSKIVPSPGSFTLLQPPGTKAPSATQWLNRVSVTKPSDKPPLVLVVEKPKALPVVEKPAIDPSLSKPSAVPGLDKPPVVLLADDSKTVSAVDQQASGSSAGLLLQKLSAVAAMGKTPEVQKPLDRSPEVPAVCVLDQPPTTVMPATLSARPVTDGSSVLDSDEKLTTVLSSDSAPDLSLQSKTSTLVLPVSEKPSEDPVLDKSPVVDVSGESTASCLQNIQEKSGTNIMAEGSTSTPIVLSSDHSYSSDSSLTSPVKANKPRPTSPTKDATPEHRNTPSAEALTGNAGMSEPSASLPSSCLQAESEHLLFKEMLDLAPLSLSVDGREDEIQTVEIDSEDHEDDDCFVVSEKRPEMEEGEIGSDVEFLGDGVVLTDASDMDSDDDSVCVISDSGETEMSDDEDNTVDIETVDESTRLSVAQTRYKDRRKSTAISERARKLEGHKNSERQRRHALRECFSKMKQLLRLDDPKASKIRIIMEATKEIHHLEAQGFYLQNEKDVLIKKQNVYLKKISQSSGKSEGMILKKLQDISSRQKIVEQQRKRKQLLAESSLPEELTVPPPVPNSEILSAMTPSAMAEVFAPHSKRQPPRRPAPSSTYRLPSAPPQPEKRPKVLPNILSRRPRVPPAEPPPVPPPVPIPVPAPASTPLFTVMNPMLPGQQIITLANPLHSLVPIGPLSSLPGHKSSTPGVAAVSIRVPAMPQVIQVEDTHSLASVISEQPPEVDKPTANAITLPKIVEVISLVPPVENSDANSTTAALEKTSADLAVCSALATASTPASAGTDMLEDGEVPDGPLTTVTKLTTQLKALTELDGDKEGEASENVTKEDGAEPTLMSLLNEIVFLNQQLCSDGSKPSTPVHAPPSEPGEVLVDQPASVAPDGDRSPSPLFLHLNDEEAGTSTPIKSMSTNTPQTPVNELACEPPVKVVPPSGSTPAVTPAPILSTTMNGQSQPVVTSAVKGDALAPPPLLQMKAGSVVPPVDPSLKDNLSWRPMPKLVPLGLKGTPQTSLSRGSTP